MQVVSIVLWNDDEIGIKKTLDIPVVIMAGGPRNQTLSLY